MGSIDSKVTSRQFAADTMEAEKANAHAYIHHFA
jgi:hypothetical protein